MGRRSPWFDAANGLVMSDILQSWLDQLVGPNLTYLYILDNMPIYLAVYVCMYVCMYVLYLL